jgi:hypothetical protein
MWHSPKFSNISRGVRYSAEELLPYPPQLQWRHPLQVSNTQGLPPEADCYCSHLAQTYITIAYIYQTGDM